MHATTPQASVCPALPFLAPVLPSCDPPAGIRSFARGGCVIPPPCPCGATCAGRTRGPGPLRAAPVDRQSPKGEIPFLPPAAARRVARTSGCGAGAGWWVFFFFPDLVTSNQSRVWWGRPGTHSGTADAVPCTAAPYTSVRLTERDVSGTTTLLSRWPFFFLQWLSVTFMTVFALSFFLEG